MLRKRKGGSLDLLYPTLGDSYDIHTWSGTVYFLAKALQDNGAQLERLNELQQRRLMVHKAVNRLYAMIGSHGPMPIERTVRMAERFAATITKQMAKGRHDAIFSPSSIPVALLHTDKPKVFITDATFADLLEQYPELTDYPADLIDQGHELERAALANCDLAFYSSQWAAESAMRRYGADPAKVRVVPFGSNLEFQLPDELVWRAIDQRPMDHCELLLLGVNWERKGGPLAVEVVEELNRAGLPARLTVVGCQPAPGTPMEHVRVVPFIDKSTAMGQRRLINHLLRTHFLLLPSVAECYGVVHAEASSLGVPSLARNVGGVGEVVRTGRNGFLFDPATGPAPYVERILTLMADSGAYRELAHSAMREHKERLNWKVAGASLMRELMPLVGHNGIGQADWGDVANG